ncbi:MAG: hypothetical protein Q8Q79_09740, partial [Sphingopyxis sp.]|nr:hypothetical protein [Sphingopyxis sp.]
DEFQFCKGHNFSHPVSDAEHQLAAALQRAEQAEAQLRAMQNSRTWKALHHLFLRLPKLTLSKRWTAFPVPDRVRINSWESLRSVTRLSVDFLVSPARSLPASLATTLDVPAVFRLCRPMI